MRFFKSFVYRVFSEDVCWTRNFVQMRKTKTGFIIDFRDESFEIIIKKARSPF